MKNLTKNNAGFTLLELVLVISIAGILALFVSSFIFYEVNNFVFSNDRQENLHNSRWALQIISSDLRQVVTPDSIIYADDDSMSFYNVSKSIVSYRYTSNQILRNGDLLLSNVDSCGFRYYDNEGDELSAPVSDLEDIYLFSVRFTTSSSSNALKLSANCVPRNF